MSRRSPARFLAPLALLTAVLTVFLVTRSELDSSSSSQAAKSTSTSSKTSTAKATSTKKGTKKRKASPKTYTVKPGDVLGSISDRTGVSVPDLQDYNSIDDAQNLSVGQKLKLTP